MIQSYGSDAESHVGRVHPTRADAGDARARDGGRAVPANGPDGPGTVLEELADRLRRGLAQDLVHLRYELDYVARHPDDATPDTLEALAALTGEILADVGALIRELVDDEGEPGLTDALRAYCRGLERSHAPRVRVHGVAPARLPSQVEGAVLRLACDAIHQAFRHGDVQRVDVYVSDRSGRLQVEIVDDGWRLGTPGDRRIESRLRAHRQLEARAARLDLEVDRPRQPPAGNLLLLRSTTEFP